MYVRDRSRPPFVVTIPSGNPKAVPISHDNAWFHNPTERGAYTMGADTHLLLWGVGLYEHDVSGQMLYKHDGVRSKWPVGFGTDMETGMS